LTAGLVREFGRYPDLRRIDLELSGQTMTLQILPTGEISREFSAEPPKQHHLVKPADFLDAMLLKLPIVIEERTAGQVVLYHSVARINSQIGHQMQVAFSVFTLFVIAGSVVTGVLVLVADRTILRKDRELAEAQRRLLASERLASVGAVADAVAHEINNPVGVLVTRSDFLLSVIQDRPLFQEIREDLDTIRRQAQRVAKTIQDLLSSTRGARRTWAAVDVETVVEAAIKLVSPSMRDRRVQFDFRRPAQPLRVWGDQDRLEQVLVNLLTNAVQAIQDRGRVTVEVVERDSEWIELVVTDTGSGIAPEHLPRIFDRFFTTKAPGFGSGLGLSIVSGIIRDHGGQIVVDSSLGKGSSFRVVLRSYAPSQDSPAPWPTTQPRL
jgi:signal transduction histidine kinase